MSESRSDDQTDRPHDRADPRPKPELTSDSDADPAIESPAVERRAFLRQLTGEAMTTSARLAGLSSAMRRSLFAAVESATADVDPVTGPEPVAVPAAEADAPATLPPTVPAPATATIRPATPVSPVALSARQ